MERMVVDDPHVIDETAGRVVALPIQFAGRTLGRVRRMLRHMRYSIDDLVEGRASPLPPPGRDGWFIRSLPVARLPELQSELTGWLVFVRQQYRRHHHPMAGIGFENWWQGFSAKTRSTLSRKARRLAEQVEGKVAIRAYRSPDEIRAFMGIAGPLADRTYQAALLQAGLPTAETDIAAAVALAERDDLRCFLLFAGERPVAYLYLPVEKDVLIYGFLGYDPEFAHLSPGTVLHVEAMRQLFAEARFRHFDFTEGDGAHKAQFGRAAVECADVIALRPTLRNRAALALIRTLDGAAKAGKTVLERSALGSRIGAFIRRK